MDISNGGSCWADMRHRASKSRTQSHALLSYRERLIMRKHITLGLVRIALCVRRSLGRCSKAERVGFTVPGNRGSNPVRLYPYSIGILGADALSRSIPLASDRVCVSFVVVTGPCCYHRSAVVITSSS
jgi:hypothetical protein